MNIIFAITLTALIISPIAIYMNRRITDAAAEQDEFMDGL